MFSADWITDCIREGRLLKPQPYILGKVEKENQKILNLRDGRQKFTLRELIKVFQTVQYYPREKTKNVLYWTRFIKMGFFPGRTVNSVNLQWQKFYHYQSIEEAIFKARSFDMPYSLRLLHCPEQKLSTDQALGRVGVGKKRLHQDTRPSTNYWASSVMTKDEQQVGLCDNES